MLLFVWCTDVAGVLANEFDGTTLTTVGSVVIDNGGGPFVMANETLADVTAAGVPFVGAAVVVDDVDDEVDWLRCVSNETLFPPLPTTDKGGGCDDVYVSSGIQTMLLFIGDLFNAAPSVAEPVAFNGFNIDPVEGPFGNDFRALGIDILLKSRTLIAALFFLAALIRVVVEVVSMSSSIIIKLSSSELVSVLTMDRLSSAIGPVVLHSFLAGVFSAELSSEMLGVMVELAVGDFSTLLVAGVFSFSVSFFTSKNGTKINGEPFSASRSVSVGKSIRFEFVSSLAVSHVSVGVA